MLFSLCPAMTSTRICRSAASTSNPSRTSLMTADPRMLSGPALQIVKRTTPRGSRSTPQWGLSICMDDLAVRSALWGGSHHFPGNRPSCQGTPEFHPLLPLDVGAAIVAIGACRERNKMQLFAATDVIVLLQTSYGTTDALLEGTQAG